MVFGFKLSLFKSPRPSLPAINITNHLRNSDPQPPRLAGSRCIQIPNLSIKSGNPEYVENRPILAVRLVAPG
jgi:hypothetical protein